jgi:hypothetical protein
MVEEIRQFPKVMAVEIAGGGVLSTGGVQAAADRWLEGM